jgi:hypothetical protein
VLVHDSFPFGSRAIPQRSVSDSISVSCAPTELQAEARAAVAARLAAAAAAGLSPTNNPGGPNDPKGAGPEGDSAEEYNRWASDHEHVIAKSLFTCGISWPGLLVAEDTAALDALCGRAEVDPGRVGCGGLSGGGLRTLLLGALDDRVACTAQAGYFTTARDMALNLSFGHSWQVGSCEAGERAEGMWETSR